MQRVWVSGLAIVVTSCGSPSPSLSPSFVAVHNTMAAMGFAQSGDIHEGTLAEGAIARFPVRIPAGQCHTFVAFGGDGVEDIDVLVFDDAGAELATDRTQSSHASTQFCSRGAGDYQVAVRMTRGGGSYVISAWGGTGGGAGGSELAGPSGGGQGTCAAPIPLELGTPVRGDTRQGQSEMTGSCIQGGEAREIVYQVTLERRAQLNAVITSTYDGALYLLATCGDMRSEIACNDDAPNTSRSEITTTLDPGTYFLVVDGFGRAEGEYELLAQVTELQNISQVCAAALPLTPGRAVTGSTAGRPNYFQATCAGGAQSGDQVYALDVPGPSRVRVRQQSNHDGALYIRSSCEDPSSEVACNDDYIDTNHSLIITSLPGGRHYVFSDGYGQGNEGDYSMRVDLAPPGGVPGAAGDDCSSPGTVQLGSDFEVDTFAATDQFQGSCGGQGTPDSVYRLNVPNRVRLRARLDRGEFTPLVYIRRQCDQAGTEVACGSLDRRSPQGFEADLSPGDYFLVVDGADPAEGFGAARIELAFDDLAALERACRTAPLVRPGRTLRGDTSGSSDRFQASCAGGARSNDLVYRLVVPRRSRVLIESAQQYDGALYLRTDCLDPATEVACNDDHGDNRHSRIETVLDRGTYYLFVDGFSVGNQGSFTVDVTLSAP